MPTKRKGKTPALPVKSGPLKPAPGFGQHVPAQASAEQPRIAVPVLKRIVPLPSRPRAIRRPVRFKPGTVARRMVQKLQKSTKRQMARMPVERFLRSELQNLCLSKEASDALRELAEVYLQDLVVDAGRIATMDKKKTLQTAHVALALKLKRGEDPRNEEDPHGQGG